MRMRGDAIERGSVHTYAVDAVDEVEDLGAGLCEGASLFCEGFLPLVDGLW